MRISVFGANGQLGAAIVREFEKDHEVKAFDRASVDIADVDKVRLAVESSRPDVMINCAAYNAVDAAEDHPVEALQANAFGVRNLSRAARSHGALLVHYGSDFVFDGRLDALHVETERPNPQSTYAMSKMLGEWFAADAPKSYVLRVESLFGSPAGRAKGTVASMVQSLRTGTPLKVIEDRTVSPTFIVDAARATRALVEGQKPFGLYHCVNSGSCTWLEFVREAARLLRVEPRLDIVKFADVQLRAPRPKYCALSNEKLVALGIAMPTWQDALRRYLVDDVGH